MGSHRDPNRHDTNPFRGLFRTFEPAHTGLEPDNIGKGDRWEDPRDVHSGETSRWSIERESETDTGDRWADIGYSMIAVGPERSQDDADEEIALNRSSRRWPLFLGLSAALSAVVLGIVLGYSGSSAERVSVRHSPGPTVFVTVRPSAQAVKAKPLPAVTKTIRPAPIAVTSYAPGPRVTIVKTPRPVVSVRISRVPVPGPTITVECTITVIVSRSGVELERLMSGPC